MPIQADRELQSLKDEHPIPNDVTVKCKRGMARMDADRAKRRECWGFYEGQQFYWTNAQRTLIPDVQTANADGTKKPSHVQRTVRNFIVDIVASEVSGAIQRIPSYSVSPTTTDPEDRYAAWLAEKLAVYGYDKWNIRHATERVITHAIVGDEGFAWPYFDNTVGPYVAEGVGQGELRLRTFGADEVFWEVGVDFMDSRWLGIKQARDIQDVRELDGFNGGKLTADATKDNDRTSQEDSKLVMVTEYLERPCPKYPMGRWITMANDRVVVDERPYPCVDPSGSPVDEPVLHRLYYFPNPNSDRNMGLVRHLLDAQRTINNSVNRFNEWVTLAMNPQLIMWNGGFSKGTRMSNEPGAVYQAFGSGKVEWRSVPPIPPELFQQKREAINDLDRISGRLLTGAAQLESGREAQVLGGTQDDRRGNWYANIAEFHSRLMRHCLYLAQRHYTEDRLISLQGRSGPDLIPSFRGAQLRGQMDVRVDPASLVPRTQESTKQEVMNIAQMFPGYFPPEVLLSALNHGTAEKLIEDYELDVARANEIVQQVRLDPESLLSGPMRPVFPNEDAGPLIGPDGAPVPQLDEMGYPAMDEMGQMIFQQATEVPEWMPRPFDGIPIQKAVVESFCKTRDYTLLDAPGKEAVHLYYSALLDIETRKAQRDSEIQTQMAEQQGAMNAAKPTSPKVMGSLPALPS